MKGIELAQETVFSAQKLTASRRCRQSDDKGQCPEPARQAASWHHPWPPAHLVRVERESETRFDPDR